MNRRAGRAPIAVAQRGERPARLPRRRKDRLERGIRRRRERRAREDAGDRGSEGEPRRADRSAVDHGRRRRGRDVAGSSCAGRRVTGTLHVADRTIAASPPLALEVAGDRDETEQDRRGRLLRYSPGDFEHRYARTPARGPSTDPIEARHDASSPAPASNEGAGSRGAALAVAGLSFGVLLVFPVLIVVGVYTFITIYAIVKAVSGGLRCRRPRHGAARHRRTRHDVHDAARSGRLGDRTRTRPDEAPLPLTRGAPDRPCIVERCASLSSPHGRRDDAASPPSRAT